MNAPHVEEELLQRYFDGDLQGAPAASVSQHIATCEDCKKRHSALGELHKLIAMSMEHAALDVDFERAFANIEQGTRERPAPGMLERLSVWWRDLVEQRPEQLWAPAFGAAMAAALLVFVLRDGGREAEEVAAAPVAPKPPIVVAAPSVNGTAPTTLGGSAAPGMPSSVPPAPPEMANTEIEQVDFGSNAGTVYEIALAGGVSTPVVWINDEL